VLGGIWQAMFNSFKMGFQNEIWRKCPTFLLFDAFAEQWPCLDDVGIPDHKIKIVFDHNCC